MLKMIRIFAFANAIALLACFSVTAQNVDGGKTIFTHVWTPGDPLSPNGDGLGPVFNGRSCVECHNQGGVGGGGDLKNNMDFVSSNAKSKSDKNRLAKTHPGFLDSNGSIKASIVLHRFSLDQVYSDIRSKMLQFDGAIAKTDEDLNKLRWAIANQPLQPVSFNAHVKGLRSQRNSPALFGAGLINKVTLKQLLKPVKTLSPNVTGRVALIGQNPVDAGRFGWRGQIRTVEEFVAAACANELGLENSIKPQFADPRNPNYRPPGLDLSDPDLKLLIDFVKSLPRPDAIVPVDKEMADRVVHGKQVFHSAGCADCHVENRAGISEIYSDLLLHDMGSKLADPVLPPLKRLKIPLDEIYDFVDTNQDGIFDMLDWNESVTQNTRPISAHELFGQAPPNRGDSSDKSGVRSVVVQEGYGGRSKTILVPKGDPVPDVGELSQEWRTPPLWGVAASAPYLHDGRAPTLLEAIMLHGGEAQDSVDNFLGLSNQDQLKLIEFLQALKAPKQ